MRQMKTLILFNKGDTLYSSGRDGGIGSSNPSLEPGRRDERVGVRWSLRVPFPGALRTKNLAEAARRPFVRP